MRSIFRLFFVLLLLAGWGVAAASLHVVRFSDRGFGIVPKNRLAIDQTYLDVRAWTPEEAAARPDFIARLTAAGKLHWLPQPAADATPAKGVPVNKLPPKMQPGTRSHDASR